MECKKENVQVVFELSKEEAIVLFDWLTRFNEIENIELFNDESEKRVLFDMESLLERELTEPLKSNYLEILLKARNKLKEGYAPDSMDL